MRTLKTWLLAVGWLLPCAAGAAGLGQMNVISALGQPFLAEIDVLSAGKEDANTLLVRLATPETYQQAGVEYSSGLRGITLAIVQRPNGRIYIRVSSLPAVNEPFVNLVIELDSPAGKLVRTYTALLDPPGYGSASQALAPAAPGTRPAPAARAPTAAPAPAAATGTDYGPVKRGETLSRIAASVKPEGVSLEQMLIGILRANPNAFIGNNINRMKAGVTLRIPAREQLADLAQDAARKEVRVQTADWGRYRRKVAESAGMASERGPGAGKPVSVRVKEGDTTDGKDVLKLSSGQPPGAKARSSTERIQNLEEELIARDRALNEANARIKDLEKAVRDTSAKK